MSSTVVALPETGDHSKWNDTEKALVEAAGLVSRGKLAPRPVVEAFLVHCRRTGLDPIARQIYCIERGGKWGTQISIDGARLVAERSGQYRGQTPTQWTADGVTWTDVWLSKDDPAAARVGVYREGFQAPLFAVATFDAYNAGSSIWKKMPALMLGKCAEMLALRKAFPQDLSGLYSTEEMQQADAKSPAAASVSSPPRSAPVEDAPRYASKDWAAALAVAGDVDQLRAVYEQVEAAAEVGLPLNPVFRDSLTSVVAQWELDEPPATVSAGQLIGAVKRAMEAAPVVAEVVDEPAEGEPVQEWVTAPIPNEAPVDVEPAADEPF
ncbi:phage recombination protein Bet [Herbiconiux sp.]|uniref:phage recombination protein Bet n=1 Tax=Herbiconiux sp. TaxID=1871186 RepID=UPI0025B88A63|nr:phage recombination protein Bet [Herbiconiux sp.]